MPLVKDFSAVDSQIIPFIETGTIAVQVGTSRFRFPHAAHIIACSAAINTAPTGASVIVDINKNGTTIYTTQGNRPTIAAGTNSATETTPNVQTVASGDYITVDIDQVGGVGNEGEDLTVFVRWRHVY